jgi:hypothetical protein
MEGAYWKLWKWSFIPSRLSRGVQNYDILKAFVIILPAAKKAKNGKSIQ